MGAFLEITDPGGSHAPQLLDEDNMRRFASDRRSRIRESLPALALCDNTGQPSTVTAQSGRLVFNHARAILRAALDSGQAEELRLPRRFVVALPAGGAAQHRARRPFPDPVARALADQGDLQALADRYDPKDRGICDAWETLVSTGRRANEVLQLRLECLAVHSRVPFLWHDQTKVGNLDEAIRIPEALRLQNRQQATLERFEDRHSRPATTKERAVLALLPSPNHNSKGTEPISYAFFQKCFSSWLQTSTSARGSLTRLVILWPPISSNTAPSCTTSSSTSARSPVMAEHYAKAVSSEIDDVLELVWGGGPDSAHPGELLVWPTQGMSKKEAEAMALDLARRRTPAEGGFCTFQPVVRRDARPHNLDCHNCDKFVMSGAYLLYWRRKAEQWRPLAERAPPMPLPTHLHQVFEPTARTIDGLGAGPGCPRPARRRARAGSTTSSGLLRPPVEPRLPHQRPGRHKRRPSRRHPHHGQGHPMTAPAIPAARTAHAFRSRRKKAEEGLTRIKAVLDQTIKARTPISMAGVARAAEVSRTFLYEHADARALVTEAMSQAAGRRVQDRRTEQAEVEAS
ncbi:hypothetical protein [Streptomyces sp. NPDC048436]|uniref:hypothetical protein n=1 Tax=Streptomyces sp. NPDC048436 TaxID=3365550 RepID=UPI003714802F